MDTHVLLRSEFRPDGIFGEFTFSGDDTPFMVTLEHAYLQADGSYLPKTPPGTYRCVRGIHHLHSGPVETFEVMGVEGHSGILCCHVGCFNRDSEGCVLAGQEVVEGKEWWINHSRDTYAAYMKRLEGVDEFYLLVR